MLLSENSLYTNAQERASLLLDKQKVTNAFYLNVLGFLGLLKINDKAGAMVSYLAQEKKLRPANIDDTNNDPSLVLKLALDAGIITQPAAVSLSKLLVLIKTKKVRGADLNEDLVRDIIKQCRIQSHRPAQKIFNEVQEFVDGKQNIKELVAAFYKMSKLPDFTDISNEFRDLVTRGGYIGEILKLNSPATNSTPNVAPTIAAKQISMGRTATASMPPNGAQSGTDSEYMDALMHMFKMRTAGQGYLERFGFKASFDSKRFKEFVQRPDFILAPNPHVSWDRHPFALWVKRQDPTAYDTFLKAVAAKSSSSIAVTTQVAAIVAQSAQTKPKPAVVLAPAVAMINRESIEELINQETTQTLNAALKKWNIKPEDVNNSANLKKITDIIQDEVMWSYALDMALLNPHDSAMGIDTTPFFRWVARHTNLRDASTKWPSIAIISTINQLAKLNKVNEWLTMINCYSFSLANQFGSSSLLSMIKFSNSITSLGLRDETTVLNYWMADPKKFTRLKKMTEFDGFNSIVIGALRYDISGYNELSKKNLIERINLSMGNKNAARIVGSTIVIDQNAYDAMAPNAKKALDYLKKLNMFNFEVRSMTDKERILSGIKDAISKVMSAPNSINSLPEEKALITDFVSSFKPTDPEVKGHRDWAPSLNWIYESFKAHSPAALKWAVEWLAHSGEVAAVTIYSTVSWAKDVIEFTIDNASTMERSKLEVAIKQMRVLSFKDGLQSLFHKVLSLRDPALDKLMMQSLSVSTVFALLEYKNHPVLDHVTDYQYHSGIWVEKDLNEFIKFLKRRVDVIKDIVPNAEEVPRYISNSHIIRSAWGILPGDERWDTAVKTVLNGPTPNFQSSSAKVAFAFNPKMAQLLREKMKSEVKNGLQSALTYSNIAPPDEISDVLVEASKHVRGMTSAMWENSNYVQLLTGLKDPNVTNAAKKAVLRRYVNEMDTLKVGSLNKDYINAINEQFTDNLIELWEKDAKAADSIFEDIRTTTRNMLIKKMGEEKYMDLIKDELYKYPIKPNMQLDKDRIKQVLKYNKLDIVIPKGKKDIKKMSDISGAIEKGVASVGQLKVKETNTTQEDHDKISVDLHKLRSEKHGTFAMKVKNTWDVEFPGNKERIEAFKTSRPGTETLPRVFHGTGTVAASMILRNGFVVLPQNDQSAVGRALGNGIYFSDITNKAAQYVSDAGFGRRFGTEGYLFEMEAALGNRNKDYRSAGFKGSTDESRNFLSPEWCVFDPKNQLRIYKVHFIELVPMKDIDELVEKHKTKLNEVTSMSFENFLKEKYEDDTLPDNMVTSTYLFMDWSIPTGVDTVVSMEKFKVPKNVRMSLCGDGVVIEVTHLDSIDPVIAKVPNTLVWQSENPEQVENFLAAIKTK